MSSLITADVQPSIIVAVKPLSEVNVTRWRAGVVSQAQDMLAEEVPIALIYNGISHAVMLATPQDYEDFALGFSLSEGILQNKNELYDIEIVEQAQGVELRLDVAAESFVKLKERRRNLVGRTGCGLCGAESLDQALRLPGLYKNLGKNSESTIQHQTPKNNSLQANSHEASGDTQIMPASIIKAFHAIKTQQTLQQVTGATHACAWVSADGDVKLVREDVGRHNAMDKLMGALARCNSEFSITPVGFVLTSSRASVEMVQKVAIAGFGILAAISAPTGLAVRVAEAYGVTLIGFLRDNQFVIYTHKHRILF